MKVLLARHVCPWCLWDTPEDSVSSGTPTFVCFACYGDLMAYLCSACQEVMVSLGGGDSVQDVGSSVDLEWVWVLRGRGQVPSRKADLRHQLLSTQ
jgi:hypothetical protein